MKNVVELDGVLLHPGHHVVAPVGLHEERVVLYCKESLVLGFL